MKLLLDTNFLMIPFTLKVDIFSQFKEFDPHSTFSVIDRTVQELQYLQNKGSGNDKAAAKMALQALKKLKIAVIPTEQSFKNVDQVLVDIAQKYALSVATQDRALQVQLKKIQVPVYRLRQKKYVQLI